MLRDARMAASVTVRCRIDGRFERQVWAGIDAVLCLLSVTDAALALVSVVPILLKKSSAVDACPHW
ncbi:hypothetical protein J4E08_04285 [Sagittula sp. NFXS13]|uniref:hypothetical protein n=1 Tax=Sagittula sp. NFXS13 TaxID=2819095 RepID=UPI0032DE8B46